MPQTNDHRVDLIQDAISGLGFQMAAPETVVYQFVDYLSVLLQSGKIITIWNTKNDQLIYSSLGDQALIKDFGQPDPEKERVALDSTYAIQVNPLNREKDYAAKQADYQAIEQVISRFRSSDSTFLNGLIHAVSVYEKPPFQSQQALELKADTVNELLSPMRKLIDDVFYDLRKSHVFQVKVGDLETAKLFAVVRTVRSQKPRYSGFFNYTASLLLSEAQRAVITHILDDAEGAERAKTSLETLEKPLGENDRSVADTVFCSGNVGFKGEVKSKNLDVAGDAVALERQRVEEFVYKKLHGFPPDKKLYVFYIPVHVAGVPWLALFTFTDKVPQSNEEAWKQNYHIYRDVIPRITSQIRSGSRQIYLNLLAEKFTARLHRSKLGALPLEALTRGVSQDWQEINQVYPYARVRLKEATTDSPPNMVLQLDDGQKVAVEVSTESTFLPRDVKHDLLDKASVPKVCRTALERYLTMNISLQKQTAAYNTHSLRNPLLTLRSIVNAAEMQDRTRLALNTQVNELLALEGFSNYLVNLKQNRKPIFVPARNPQRFEELQQALTNALEVHEDSSYEGNSDSLLQIKANQALTTSFEELEKLGNSTLEFCAEEMNIVVNGLITNALKYNKMAAPELHVSTILDDGKVFLKVRNPSDNSSEELQTLAADLSSPADIHLNFVGVNLIHLACRACDFSAPVWEENDSELVAIAQVARY